ncbi:DUF5125 domain-containing protein [Parapedobacter indicus]|uniref:DUF5125 domain-containing protein n=1 Tax=Parapedobacter indicus TaxID=1477437 RepID=A0A1I3JZQ5_9SPHI|nr:DUF5125 domain-containing protein [Parapedobacter indicus]PPL01666.1 uncharacterized protein DUF5016 [Parapedobacter indicus]SFI65731.1 protein of unknown function [Parapedobacter indicus]
MKNPIITLFLLAGFLAMNACKKEEQKAPGNPVLNTKTEFASAYFGDSLQFTVGVSDDARIPLSTLKARLYYSDELVSETVIRTKAEGDYTGKIYIPYYADVPNGTATLKLVLQNINFTIREETYELPLERPDYPYVTLVAADDTEYRMERTGLYMYTASTSFPAKVNGYIKTPAYGQNGNELTFGWVENAIKEGSTSNIPFSNAFSGNYSITFNTLNYEASPFIIAYAINQTVMDRVDDNTYQVDLALNHEEPVVIDGFEDLDAWWIDPDYFARDASGNLLFQPKAGNYRITADFNREYFIVEALNGSDLATLQTDGSGAVWIIGEGIGKPSVATNAVGWTTEKALCMAPVADKTYQITVVAGTTVTSDNINFKFFHQKGWGGEFTNAALSTTSDLIFVGDGSNGRDPGNLGIAEGQTLEVGATYVLTLDLTGGNDQAVLTVEKK